MAALYLLSIVAANLILAHFGPAAAPWVAFGLVGFTMTARDRLHDRWVGRGLGWRMALLLAVGGLLSAALNADALRIAFASSAAFAASEAANALAYHPMLRRGVPWLTRVNAGNLPNAVIDSAVFVTVAFGFAPAVIAAQVAAKLAGGALFSGLLSYRRRPAPQGL